MSTIIINRARAKRDVLIPSGFITDYMPQASGEYVKVYISLLQHLEQGLELSASDLADALDITEKDIMRALKYWDKVGVLSLEYDKKVLCSINLLAPWENSSDVSTLPSDISYNSDNAAAASQPVSTSTEINPSKAPVQASPVYVNPIVASLTLSPEAIKAIEADANFQTLLTLAQTYFKKLISGFDYEKFLYFYERMNRDFAVCELLVEYCANEKSRAKISYLEKLSCECVDMGLTKSSDIRTHLTHIENRLVIIKALGLPTTNLPEDTEKYVDKWFLEYGMNADVIKNACKRAFRKERPFEYVDKILLDWEKNGIRTVAQIEEADKKHKAEMDTQFGKGNSKPSGKQNRFNQFEQRTDNPGDTSGLIE